MKTKEIRRKAVEVEYVHEAFEMATANVAAAREEVLGELVASVAPALSALCHPIDHRGQDAPDDESGFPLEDTLGLLVAGTDGPRRRQDPRGGSDGTYEGRSLWLCHDGRFRQLSYHGRWTATNLAGAREVPIGEWKAHVAVMTLSDVVVQWGRDIVDEVTGRLVKAIEGQLRGKKTKAIAELQAERVRLRACAAVLAQGRSVTPGVNSQLVDGKWVGLLSFPNGKTLRVTHPVESRELAEFLADLWRRDALASQVSAKPDRGYSWIPDPVFPNYGSWHICIDSGRTRLQRPVLLPENLR